MYPFSVATLMLWSKQLQSLIGRQQAFSVHVSMSWPWDSADLAGLTQVSVGWGGGSDGSELYWIHLIGQLCFHCPSGTIGLARSILLRAMA